MPLTIQNSTIVFLTGGEDYQPKLYYDGRDLPTIGIGTLLANPASNWLKANVPGVYDKYIYNWRGRDLRTATVSLQDSIQLISDHSTYLYGGAGIPARINSILNTFGSTPTQNQFDALFSIFYNVSKNGKTATNIDSALRQYGNDLIGNKAKIKEHWLYIDPASGAKNYNGLFNRRNAEFDLFYNEYIAANRYKYAYKRPSTTGGLVFVNNSKEYHEQRTEQTNNENEYANPPSRDLTGLFAEIDLNMKNLEADQTDADWGSRSNKAERSDWVSLKSFIIYLCTRYAPHVLVPFIELIPEYQMDESKLNQVQEDSRKNIDKVVQDVASKYMQSLDSETIKTVKQRIQQTTEKIPGYNETRYNNQVKAFNKASGTTDLFKLDPFGEDFQTIHGNKTKSGETTYKKKNIGIRIYGQVVLSPSAEDNELSKAGAIGFEEFVVKQGKQAFGNVSIIELKLRDVQGNKFNDINSPWAFLFDARPGTQSGDFLLRYGWSLQLPYGNNVLAEKFWNHPGWGIFDKDVKPKFEKLAREQQELILCQSLVTDSYDKNGAINVDKIKNEHAQYTPGSTTNSGFMSISLINPSVTTDSDGSLLATIQFYCGGLLTRNCPITLSYAVRELFANNPDGCLLSDLIIAFNHDQLENGTMQIADPEAKKKQQQEITAREKGQDISSLLLVLGAEDNQQVGENALDPNTINIEFNDNLKKRLNDNNSQETLKSWLIEALKINDCTLLNFGSGAGLSTRVPYIIMCTSAEASPAKKINLKDVSKDASIDSILMNDYDVFSYRHQGSLVERMEIGQTETPNQYTIAMNFRAAQWLAQSSDSVDEQGQLKQQNLSILDRKASLVNLFGQLQEVELEVLAHTWMGLGNTFFIKGQGWNDGKYSCIEITHTLDNTQKFISTIRGIRIPPTGVDNIEDLKLNSTITDAITTKKTDIPENKDSKPPVKKIQQKKDINNKALNYIIGDLYAKKIANTTSDALIYKNNNILDNITLNQLSSIIDKFDVNTSTKNLFVSIGYYSNYSDNDNIPKFCATCITKFPKAKIYIIVGPNSPKEYYDKFVKENCIIMPTPIGVVTEINSSNNIIIQIGKEIDAICNNKPLPIKSPLAKIKGTNLIKLLHPNVIPIYCIELDQLCKQGIIIEVISTFIPKTFTATNTIEEVKYENIGLSMIIRCTDLIGNIISQLPISNNIKYKLLGDGKFLLDLSPIISYTDIYHIINNQFTSLQELIYWQLNITSSILNNYNIIYYGVDSDKYIPELRNIRRDSIIIEQAANIIPKITGIKKIMINTYEGVGKEQCYRILVTLNTENIIDASSSDIQKKLITMEEFINLLAKFSIVLQANNNIIMIDNIKDTIMIDDLLYNGYAIGQDIMNGQKCINSLYPLTNYCKLYYNNTEIDSIPIVLKNGYTFYK